MPSPEQFHFHQAVRLVKLILQKRQRNNPVPLSQRRESRHEKDVRIRFHTPNSLAFPAGTVQEVAWRVGGDFIDVTAAVSALTGPHGVLPKHYTETLYEQEHRPNLMKKDGNRAPQDFFDLFSHYFIELMCDAWEARRPAIAFERDEDNGLLPLLLALQGYHQKVVPTPARTRSNPLPARPETYAYYTGLLSSKRRSRASVELALADYLGDAVRIEQYVGQWLAIPEEFTCRLGARGTVLGQDAALGSRLWECQSTIQVIVGPLSGSRYVEYAAEDQSLCEAVVAFLRAMIGITLSFELVFVISASAVSDGSAVVGLGVRADHPTHVHGVRGPVLGRTSWLKEAARGKAVVGRIVRVSQGLPWTSMN